VVDGSFDLIACLDLVDLMKFRSTKELDDLTSSDQELIHMNRRLQDYIKTCTFEKVYLSPSRSTASLRIENP